MFDRTPELLRKAFVPPVRRTLDASVAGSATPRVPVLLVFWKKAPAATFENMPELLRNAPVPPVRRTLDALLKMPALLRNPAAAVIVRLLARIVAPPTPSVPVLLVVWKKAPAAVFDRMPELLRRAPVPPVRRTLDALLKTPALLRKPAAAVIVRLLARMEAPPTPRVPVLLVVRKKAPAAAFDRMPELLRRAPVPPVRRTLDALLKTPALLRKPAAAVIVRLLARMVAPATPRVVALLVDRKKAPAAVFDRMPELLRKALVPPVRSTLDARVAGNPTPSVPRLLVFWKKAPPDVLERIPELLTKAPVRKTLDALLKTPALLRKPAAAVIVRLLARMEAPPTPRVPVLLVVRKNAPAAAFDRMPELLRRAPVPPVRRTLDALLKMPALLRKPAAAVIVRLLARMVAPATPRVVLLLVDRK